MARGITTRMYARPARRQGSTVTERFAVVS